MAHRIGIMGITGRMGQLLAEEVRAAGAILVGGISHAGSGKPAPAGVTLLPDLSALAAASGRVRTTAGLLCSSRVRAGLLSRARVQSGSGLLSGAVGGLML